MLKYWLWLTSLPQVGLRDQTLLLQNFGGADEIYFAASDAALQIEGLSPAAREALKDKSLERAEKLLAECYEKNIQILTWQDAAYPNRLRSIAQPPAVLYCRGRMLPFDTQPVVTVVGTRSASAYGLRCAKRLGYQIGRCGGTVVSGMARGIDAMAIEGALSAGAPVAGVLGCGVDVVYPRENGALFRDVAQWGCLLSEYPPGTPPRPGNFPVRNRILSSLSLGVLVVEAPMRSGALITASHALEQGKDVFAVPGGIDNPASAGTNQLIRDGAILATNGWDVMREYTGLFPGQVRYQPGGQNLDLTPEQLRSAAPEQPAKPAPEEKSGRDTPPLEEKAIDNGENKPYIELDTILPQVEGDEKALVLQLADKPQTADELIEKTQLPAARVMASLTLLEVQGIVQCGRDKRFSLVSTRQ